MIPSKKKKVHQRVHHYTLSTIFFAANKRKWTKIESVPIYVYSRSFAAKKGVPSITTESFP